MIYAQKELDHTKLMRERMPKHEDGNIGLKMCDKCHKFVGNATFYKHKCEYGDTEKGSPLLLHLLLHTEHPDNEFQANVLSRFHDNEVGKLCRSNRIIKEMGYRIFAKRRHEKAKIKQCRKAAMSEMRILSNLFLIYQEQEEVQENAVFEDMFRSGGEYLVILMEAIRIYGLDTETERVKHGSMLNLKSVIQRTAKHLKALYDEQGKEDKVKDVTSFIRQFTYRVPYIFAESQYRAYERTFELRRPTEMPDDESVTKLHEFIETNIMSLTNDFHISKYVLLRQFVVSRLTLYNARRGEEGTQLSLDDWEDAKKRVWVDSGRTYEHIHDTAQPFLEEKCLIAYTRGKGKKFVPILVPNDCIKGIEILVNQRREYGIYENNIFVFASKGSYNNSSGWHAVKFVLDMKQGTI